MSGMTSLGNHDKKSSWNSTSTKLSAQIAAFYKKRSDENPIIKSILTSSQKESNIERSRLMKDYRSKLLTIKNDLSQVQTVLRGTSQKVSDGAALRFILEEFESKVNTFRSTMKSNISLIESEADQLQTEVDTTSRIIAEWNEHDENIEHLNGQDSNKSVGSNSNKKKNKNKSDINITTDKSTIVDLTRRTLDHQNKLRIIEKQLSHLGGPNGGWHYQDHDMFLRVWTQTQTVPVVVISQHQHQHQQQNSIYRSNRADQNNNENRGQINEYNNDIHSLKSVVNFDIHGNQNESIASAGIQIPVMSIPSPQFNRLLFKLTPLLPQKADQELEAHVIWYLQYLSLCHAKKELIASWKRTRKNQSKNDDIYLDSDLVISIGGTHTAKSMILNDNTGYSGEASEWLPRPQMNELNRNEVKERIAEWRQRKVAVAAQNQFREKEQAEHEIKIEAQRRQSRLEEMRPLVQEWRSAREQEEAELRIALIEAEKFRRSQSVNREDAERRRQRDLEIAYKRRQTISQQRVSRHSTKAERTESLSATVRIQADRDPQRLVRSTSACRANQMTALDLKTAELMRAITPAHARRIPLSGRDLHYSHRAVPAWLKPQVF